MSEKRAKQDLIDQGYGERIIDLEESTATVALAAQVLGVQEGQIAKSLTFNQPDGPPLLILMAGDKRVDNRKFRDHFSFKAKMVPVEDLEEKIGHEVGGVCPFGIREDVQVYCDISLRDHQVLYPACGSDLAVAKFSLEEVYQVSRAQGWVDIGK